MYNYFDIFVDSNYHGAGYELDSSCQARVASSSVPFCLEINRVLLNLISLKKLLTVLREKREKGCRGCDCGPRDVYLVGTEPGDPELLTQVLRVIQSADLLLYDRLVSNDVLELVAPDARLLYVSKTDGYHSRTQEELHELLLNFAEAGATVVRLKGGDPLVFGQEGIRVQVIQGNGFSATARDSSSSYPRVAGITEASG